MSISILSTIVGAVLARTDKSPVIIAIDGPSASGKTSFANSIERDFDCNVFRMDDFFLTPERKTPERLATPGGNVDWEGFKENVLENIMKGKPFTYQKYNCQTGKYTTSETIQPKRLNIVEGVYSMHPELSGYYEYKIFLDVSREKQLARILARSNERMLQRFKREWIPLEDLYFETFSTRTKADFAFDTTKAF